MQKFVAGGWHTSLPVRPVGKEAEKAARTAMCGKSDDLGGEDVGKLGGEVYGKEGKG